jgi:methylenetetrahydrofolate reductase (NADPH)
MSEIHAMKPQLIRDIHAAKARAGKPVISFEFSPPKTDEGDVSLLEKTLPALMELKPDFCSVTYGAGGGNRDKTLSIVDQIQRRHGLTTLCHLTCVSSTATLLRDILEEARGLGIHNILALRGDPPGGTGPFPITEGGFEHSDQLIRFIKELGGFCIGAAGFPEGHVESKAGREADWDRLRAKIDAGAEFVVTQFFFNNEDYFRMRDYMAAKGVTAPIFPGVISFQSVAQIKRFTERCGASIPQQLLSNLDQYEDDDEACAEYGILFSTQQCAELLREGAPGIHFFTLNKAHSTIQVLRNLGQTTISLSPQPQHPN